MAAFILGLIGCLALLLRHIILMKAHLLEVLLLFSELPTPFFNTPDDLLLLQCKLRDFYFTFRWPINAVLPFALQINTNA